MICPNCIHFGICEDAENVFYRGAFANNPWDDCSNCPSANCHCKDCKYYIPNNELDHAKYPNVIEADGFCDNCLNYVDENHFCSYGEEAVNY